LHSRVVAISDGNRIEIGPFTPSETVRTTRGERNDFEFVSGGEEPVSDAFGSGQRHRIVGRGPDLEKTVEIGFLDEWPQVGVMQTSYANTGTQDVIIEAWGQNVYSIAARPADGEPAFWSYQSGSYEKRPDWVLPVPRGFRQENYLGMNASDYGGGTP